MDVRGRLAVVITLFALFSEVKQGGPAPFPSSIPAVVIVEETTARTPSIARIVSSEAVANAVKAKHGEYRVIDQDTKPRGEPWKSAMEADRGKLPWLFISDGKRGYSGEVPATVDELVRLIDVSL